jgi:hypothetical protein
MAGLNHTILQWLEEWQSLERTKMRHGYTRAIKSLKRYPIAVHSCRELMVCAVCILAFVSDMRIFSFLARGTGCARCERDSDDGKHLESFGPVIVGKVEARLRALFQDEGRPFPESLGVRGAARAAPAAAGPGALPDDLAVPPADGTLAPPRPRRRRVQREYIPAFRSGPYAILMALLQAEQVRMLGWLSVGVPNCW